MTDNPLATVLRDVAATYPLPVTVEPAEVGDDAEWVRLSAGDPSTAEIRAHTDLSPAERLADVAGQVADWLVESLPGAGRPAVWPECPLHPDSHPVDPRAAGDRAEWVCPATGRAVAAVGSLA